MKKTFIINGPGGAGKDTFVDYIKRDYPNLHNISSVTEIKEIATKYYGYTGDKTNQWRRILSDLKLLQTEACDGPFTFMKMAWDKAPDDAIMFFHIREPAEIDKFKEATGATTLLIRRMEEPELYGNMADDSVFSYKYNVVVFNDTLLKLSESANLFIEKFIRN